LENSVLVTGWFKYVGSAFAVIVAVATGGCSMARFAPEKYFDGAELEVAEAIDAGNLSGVRQLSPKANLNRVGREGMTLLFFAFNAKKYDAMTELVKLGANPEYEVSGFGSPLSVAVDQVDPAAFKALLAGGANPNANYKEDQPLIFEVANDDKIDHLKALLAAKANPNLKDSLGQNALYQAILLSSFTAVKLLIDQGAYIEIVDNQGVSFAWAVHKEIIRQAQNPGQLQRITAIKTILEQRGIKFPPDPPQVVRQKLGIPE
jgi:uncharacterized protein